MFGSFLIRTGVKKPLPDVKIEKIAEQPREKQVEVLIEEKPKVFMNITDKFLEKGEYFDEVFEKNVFYLHHTAGGHRADWVIAGWDVDDNVDSQGKKTPRSVATSYVIGGTSTRDSNDTKFDGQVYRCFDDKLWSHHLGTTQKNNRQLNRNSIGVEICNYGQLTKSSDGKFYTYVNTVVPNSMVIELQKPFRGFRFYHRYTDKQIASTKELILAMKAKYPKISLRTPLLTVDGFDINQDAQLGVSGVYTHSNVRKDKFDCSPQPKLIAMLKEICSPI